MDDQLSFEELEAGIATPVVIASRPDCSVCGNPVAWQPRNHQWSIYCGSNVCRSPTRPCKYCGELFTKNSGEAGTKYCSLDCKQKGYGQAWQEGAHRKMPLPACAWCGDLSPRSVAKAKWPYVCERCLTPISHVVQRLKFHNVSHERAQKLAADPGCEVCGRNMLEWGRSNDPNKRSLTPLLSVDHDHGCCPGERSCGRCIRGLICLRCNGALGLIGDSLIAASGMVQYLQRHGC